MASASYSQAINTQRKIEDTLEAGFPWCREWGDDLRELFVGNS
jgi:hypothetical protein